MSATRPICVKVCGITCPEDAEVAVEAGADLLGFNFHPPSPRYVVPGAVARMVARLPRQVLAVGVFVNADAEAVRRILDMTGIALLQFHGDESAEFCASFRVPAMKALRVASLAELPPAATAYPTGWILADTADPLRYGGTGRPLPIAPVAPALARRLFLAGGLQPDTVAEVVRRLRPLGVDVCSGVERRPGEKDHARLRTFVANAKTA